MKVSLWLIRESANARYYSKLPPHRHPTEADCLWVPLSIVEHTSKDASGALHIVTLPDWFCEREGL